MTIEGQVACVMYAIVPARYPVSFICPRLLGGPCSFRGSSPGCTLWLSVWDGRYSDTTLIFQNCTTSVQYCDVVQRWTSQSLVILKNLSYECYLRAIRSILFVRLILEKGGVIIDHCTCFRFVMLDSWSWSWMRYSMQVRVCLSGSWNTIHPSRRSCCLMVRACFPVDHRSTPDPIPIGRIETLHKPQSFFEHVDPAHVICV